MFMYEAELFQSMEQGSFHDTQQFEDILMVILIIFWTLHLSHSTKIQKNVFLVKLVG